MDENSTWWLEMVIQLCRLQIQRERENLMTPKLRGVRSSLDKLKSALEDDVNKLVERIEDTNKRRAETFAASHGVVDDVKSQLTEIDEFIGDLAKSNGGDPLDSYEEQSNIVTHPRSSEVASR